LAQNILYICQNALGDIITSLPSIHFLKNHFVHLDILINEQFSDLLTFDPHFERIIYFKSEWFDTSPDSYKNALTDNQISNLSKNYDVIVDSLCTRSTAELIQLLNPVVAIGIEFGEELSMYNRKVPIDQWQSWSDGSRNASDCFADLVRLYRSEYIALQPKLYISGDTIIWAKSWLQEQGLNSSNPLIALNPGAGNIAKCWPLERYIELAAYLHRMQCSVIFLFGPKETDLFKTHISTVIQTGAYAIHFSNSLVQNLAGLLRHCALTISNDCAVMHISAAIECPTLAIFGPSNSKIWFPYDRIKNSVVERDVSCRKNCISGCEYPVCLTDISVLDVATVAFRLLSI